jgi:hypothetical protein
MVGDAKCGSELDPQPALGRADLIRRLRGIELRGGDDVHGDLLVLQRS